MNAPAGRPAPWPKCLSIRRTARYLDSLSLLNRKHKMNEQTPEELARLDAAHRRDLVGKAPEIYSAYECGFAQGFRSGVNFERFGYPWNQSPTTQPPPDEL